uniref:NADH-ubiquinone oxidoreductase chain 5 n=1 Tax=Cerion uva TaxID=1108933 RepID=A0A343AZV0_9EUPU|nr:NADH dehydrogenase subunit 5 [Cerion uva]AQL10417.1 NADH dehydrogenase subunit 5 [Cerion uva]
MMFKSPSRFVTIIWLWFMMFSLLGTLCFLQSHPLVIFEVDLLSTNGFSFPLSWVIDPISVSFGAVVSLVAFSVFLFSGVYMADDTFKFRFTGLLFMFVVSMLILVFSQSLLSLLVGWDGLGVTSFLLIIYYQNKVSLESGFLTLMINRMGDVLIMITIIMMIPMGSALVYYPYMDPIVSVIFSLCVLASLTKSAQYPFSSWLPAAMAAPTPVSALVHSSTLVTAGIYLIIRVTMLCPNGLNSLQSVLMLAGSVTCLMGGAGALIENDIKKLIALSTLSQLGVMAISLGLGAYDLTLFHLYSHAMFKALLFMAAGHILLVSFGVQDLRLLGGTLKCYPILTLFFLLPSLCLMGAPFVTGYYSKHMLLEMSSSSSVNTVSLVFLMLSAVFSAGYMVRLMKELLSSEVAPLVLVNRNSETHYYFHMVILFFMSLVYGHFYVSVSNNYLDVTCVSRSLAIWFMMVMVLGVLVGLLSPKLPNSLMWALASMLFISPPSKNMNYMVMTVSKPLSFLDYGWLEPYNFNAPMKSLFNWLLKSYLWPYMSFSFAASLTVGLMFGLWALYLA